MGRDSAPWHRFRVQGLGFRVWGSSAYTVLWVVHLDSSVPTVKLYVVGLQSPNPKLQVRFNESSKSLEFEKFGPGERCGGPLVLGFSFL